MEELLESVQTKNLKGSFQKYLPAVLNEAVSRKETSKVALTEKTGDKVQPQKETTEVNTDENSGNIIHLKKLAGIK